MRIRPCIDLHAGKVKQIIGSTLETSPDGPKTNFETERSAAEFAQLYRSDGLTGGHVIMLGAGNEQAAVDALRAWPGGMQVGGGIRPDNAAAYIEAGASHVIVTSYVFNSGRLNVNNLAEMVQTVGRERLVLDLSCRRKGDGWRVTADRWKTLTEVELGATFLERLAESCAEFLVHAVDVEGKQAGIDTRLVKSLAEWSPIPVAYAGGVRSLEDLDEIFYLGNGKVDATVGSALDIFGGNLPYRELVAWHEASKML